MVLILNWDRGFVGSGGSGRGCSCRAQDSQCQGTCVNYGSRGAVVFGQKKRITGGKALGLNSNLL